MIGLIAQAVPSIVNVTSISSACGAQLGPAVINCTLAGLRTFAALTITGTGFATSYQNVVTVGGVYCNSNYDLGLTNVLRCDLYDGAAPWSIIGAGDSYTTPLLPVVVINTVTGVSSLPAFLISISVLTAFTVQSVSGCSDVGATTTACNTSTAVLTITGSGFVPDPPSVYQWTPFWPLATGSLTYRTLPSPLVFLPGTSSSVLMIANSSIGVQGFPLPSTGTVSIILTHANYIASTALTIGFIPTSSNSAATAPSALAGNNFTISSISGCPLLADGVTLSCARPFTLTIQGSVFPNGVSLLISVGGERCYSVESTQPTLILCQVLNSLTVTPTNATLPVIVFDLFRNYQSPPFYGVQMAPLLPPVLTNISGCVGNGNMTSSCVLATDSLTIQGANFIVDGSPWTIRLGGGLPALPAGSILDTQTVVIPILTAFPYSLSDLATSAAPVLVWLQHGSMMSNYLSISVAPSTPNITMISSVTCSSLTSFALANCTPGVSVLQISGTYFITPLTITVGGVSCNVALLDFFSIACTLPALVGYTPGGRGYDLVLTQGNNPPVTLAGAISYLAVPSITTITSEKCTCPGCVGSFSLYCDVGATISLVGSFFSPAEQLSVLISPQPSGVNPTIACLSLTVQSSALLTCQLPSLNSTLLALFSASPNAVRVFDALNNVSSNVFSMGLYRPAAYPVIDSVSGCAGADPSSPWAVVGCVTGSRITLQGANFSPLSMGGSGVTVYLYQPDLAVSYTCLTPVIVSSTVITCVLPYLINDGEEVLLPVRLSISNRYFSNWLPAVSYSTGISPTCACSASTCADGWRAAFIATVVLLSSLVVPSVVFVVSMWRRGAISGGWKKQEVATSYVRGASGGRESDREVSMRRTFEVGSNSESAGVELQ